MGVGLFVLKVGTNKLNNYAFFFIIIVKPKLASQKY